MNYTGKNLKFLIDELDITQASIESVVGKRQQTISNWTHGRNQMDAEDVVKLCDYFGLSLEDFCLKDLSMGNLIDEEYKSKFKEKGNLIGNPIGNLKSVFHQNIGENSPLRQGVPGGEDQAFWILIGLIQQLNSKVDAIRVAMKLP